ncbi:putative tellurium resistance membrane protein TerC [Mesocricetibacter intestinalis]|uniref:Putative tellurium resistance membrane protein TerC n=1 Tax=Mesocricetibacter intestinalis TaxID=1521930 RepID=A0A4R6VGC6_9PAST|nr:TerC family protein [Mesocricetibacter intestinalis]TDQ59871.1 putative tellurium resistance membrane protein TerC [Mesocricetibacter intestinalis]
MLELLTDSSAWLGLATLIVLEIILGIDNIVFIAILANKLPPQQRNNARRLGLGFALLLRLLLLSIMSWLITLTEPVISYHGFSLSLRDIILITGGVFLLFKATMELHEKLEGKPESAQASNLHASFTAVVVQIVILDAVFSFDAVITAVGMVKHLEIMMAAVIVAMVMMLFAAKALAEFVAKHPTVVILCLSFLLMIGFSLIAEGLGLHIPKGYLYAAIGFSILIEGFNQFANLNRTKYENQIPLRDRTADAILKLMGGKEHSKQETEDAQQLSPEPFAQEERYMISGVLALGERDVQTIMTPRNEITWVDINDSKEDIRRHLLDTPHNLFPVCRGGIDKVLGVVRAKDILAVLDRDPEDIPAALKPLLVKHQPIFVPETIDNLKLLSMLKDAKGNLAMVIDEYGQVAGLVTPLDLLEAIAGEFPDEDESLEIVKCDDFWIVEGTATLDHLKLELDEPDMFQDAEQYTIGGYLISKIEDIPQVHDQLEIEGYRFSVLKTLSSRILLIRVERVSAA